MTVAETPSTFPILLTGGSGQVGWELKRALAPIGTVIAPDRRSLDLSNQQQMRDTIRSFRPAVMINAAAYTAVDRAESEPDLAVQINEDAPMIMAEELKRIGGLLIHYSTDYVFDGTKRQPYTEEDEPNPLNAYGRSKLAGERVIQAVGGRFFIFRTSWVYGARGRNFLTTILQLARSQKALRIVDDQFGAPTWSRTIAEVTANVVRQAIAGQSPGASGLFHLAASGMTTWRRFAQAACDRLNPKTEIIPITSAEYPCAASRPLYSVLATGKLRNCFGLTLPDWETALGAALTQFDV